MQRLVAGLRGVASQVDVRPVLQAAARGAATRVVRAPQEQTTCSAPSVPSLPTQRHDAGAPERLFPCLSVASCRTVLYIVPHYRLRAAGVKRGPRPPSRAGQWSHHLLPAHRPSRRPPPCWRRTTHDHCRCDCEHTVRPSRRRPPTRTAGRGDFAIHETVPRMWLVDMAHAHGMLLAKIHAFLELRGSTCCFCYSEYSCRVLFSHDSQVRHTQNSRQEPRAGRRDTTSRVAIMPFSMQSSNC